MICQQHPLRSCMQPNPNPVAEACNLSEACRVSRLRGLPQLVDLQYLSAGWHLQGLLLGICGHTNAQIWVLLAVSKR